MWAIFDQAIANDLGVSVEEYINKIESISDKRMEIIIFAILSEVPEKMEQAKRIFNLIQNQDEV